MLNQSKTFKPTDRIFATLTSGGRTVVNIYKDNFRSLGDVIGLIYSLASSHIGPSRLNVRNQSQGWSIDMPLLFNSQSVAGRAVPRSVNSLHGVQSRLPW